jgi:hypothetical protein
MQKNATTMGKMAVLLKSRELKRSIMKIVEAVEEIEIKQFQAEIDREMILLELELFIKELIEASASVFLILPRLLHRIIFYLCFLAQKLVMGYQRTSLFHKRI